MYKCVKSKRDRRKLRNGVYKQCVQRERNRHARKKHSETTVWCVWTDVMCGENTQRWEVHLRGDGQKQSEQIANDTHFAWKSKTLQMSHKNINKAHAKKLSIQKHTQTDKIKEKYYGNTVIFCEHQTGTKMLRNGDSLFLCLTFCSKIHRLSGVIFRRLSGL